MAAITIRDLHINRALDGKSMSAVRGGAAPWVFGWIRPFVPGSERGGSAGGVNFFQVNNYYADQMINQIQVVDVNNTGAGAAINIAVDAKGANGKLLAALPR